MMTVDMSGYNASIQRLMKMGEVRRRDIADIFRKADRGVVSLAKATVKKSPHGVKSNRYASRTHESGNLRKGIGFAVSKKYALVYYVRAKAWYDMIYTRGHGSFMGNPFIERAVSIRGGQAYNQIKQGLDKLIQRVKENG
jgi:hypothetical protein